MNIVRRDLGLIPFEQTYDAMSAFTAARDGDDDEIWLLEHPSVFTLGRAARTEHVLAPGDIPVVRTDRGGQVTYHGPGQLVVYVMADVKRLGIGPRELVRRLEQGMLMSLADLGISAARRPGAPGVYVGAHKIGALGLRIRRGCSYHGLALNVSVDLGPFGRIDPCGYAGLEVTRVVDHVGTASAAGLTDSVFANVCEAVYGGMPLTVVQAGGKLPACVP